MQRPESPATLEEGSRKDKGYRRYASNVERALSLFDTALQEWADYIAFLGRLLKALQSKPSDTHEIPHKSIVAKRLAQCLAPSLPSGVHQKTLEVYAYVFSVLGKDGLSRDLPLWLPGLSPTLSFASLSIKPTLLSLFETFIVPLNPRILRSALKAIVLSLLPGLEEETSDEFERTLVLLSKFRSAVSQRIPKVSAPTDATGDQYFWQSLFLGSITSSSRRQGALAYMVRELPLIGNASTLTSDPQTTQNAQTAKSKKQLPPEVEAVLSPEPGLLIRCFAAGLQDDQLLIQRGFLDLLVSHMPLHSAMFHQQVTTKDLELLVVAAVSVVARREMSLNRRLWSWLLGPETSKEKNDSNPSSPSSPDSSDLANPMKSRSSSQTDYFERYGLDSLINGITKMVNNDALTPAEKARPFRICLSLMDRWEIGAVVIPRIFIPAMESMWRYQKIAPSKDAMAEVLRSANVFFDGIESSLIWAELTQIMIGALDSKQEIKPLEGKTTLQPESLLQLVLFIITKFNIREEEMLTLHIPMATLALLISLRFGLKQEEALSGGALASLTQAFKSANQLLDVIPQPIFSTSTLSQPGVLLGSSRQILGDIQLFYRQLQRGSEDVAPPLSMDVVREAILHNASQIAITTLSTSPIRVEFLERANSLLEKILRKSTGLDEHEYERLVTSLTRALEALPADLDYAASFSTLAALVSILETMKHASSSSLWENDHRIRQLLPKLLTDLWGYTSPSRPRYNVEAVRCLWRIHWISPDNQLVESSIATLVFRSDAGNIKQNIEIEGARRFMTFWAHSNSNIYSSSDRRSSIGRTGIKPGVKSLTISSNYSILERPLLLLLDSLFDKTELSMFISSWLQSLSSVQK